MSSQNSQNGLIVGGIVLCCVIGAVGYFATQPDGDGPVFGAQPETLVVVEPETPTPPQGLAQISEPASSNSSPDVPEGDDPTTEMAAPESPEPGVAVETALIQSPEAEPDDEPVVEEDAPELAPIFDIVRIDASGAGLVAGRAAPDTEIEIVNQGEVVGTTRTGRDGAFVAYIAVDPGIAAQQLIAQSAASEAVVAVQTAPLVVVASPEEDAAPVIFQPSEAGVRLIQPTPRPNDASVTLDSISYDDSGAVTFAGRAQQSAAVRLYVDSALVLETRASDDSSWRAVAGASIAPGVYTLRVDQVDDTGAVTSRLETPFLREQVEQGEIGENALTVQTGNNLWKLAEDIYGSGVRYTLIFQANRDTIRDPDLIYPGQIFKLPDAARTQ